MRHVTEGEICLDNLSVETSVKTCRGEECIKMGLERVGNRLDPSGLGGRLASGCLELSMEPLDPIKNGKYLA
jgi:hypothetical protein